MFAVEVSLRGEVQVSVFQLS